jgi:arylsulfatase A-like enzyme
LVEFVDIYPTLCELAGLPLPFHLQGQSFSPLLDDPNQSWKNEVFYRHQGETILTENHSYTEWIDYKTGRPYARMLYDLQSDPEENTNVSELPENSDLIQSLQAKLHQHIKSRDTLTF